MSRKVHETGLLIFLQEMADHAHLAAVWCSVEQSLIDGTVDQWPAQLRACVFKLSTDILNIRRDCQFVFCVLDELYATILDAAGVVLRVHYKV